MNSKKDKGESPTVRDLKNLEKEEGLDFHIVNGKLVAKRPTPSAR